jgi:drug/metabolite transporter (DMT)-like permease
VLLGLVGVVILVGFDSRHWPQRFQAELALILSAVSYAAGAVYARRFVRGLRPLVPAAFQVGYALLFTAILAFVLERPLATALTPNALIAVVWLGLLGSGFAYLVYFRLLRNWGASRTALVAYELPVWGIALGFIVLGEPLRHVGAVMPNRVGGSRTLAFGRRAAKLVPPKYRR